MSDFTPIPGVWYENADDENDQRYLYAPHPSGMYPWWGGNNQWLRADEVPPNLKVWYNPHPPTRTEWGIAIETLEDMIQNYGEAEDRARIAFDKHRRLREEAGLPVAKRLMGRQVFEWQEVTDV